jgi:cytochrome P450
MTSSPPESDIDLFCDDVLRDPYAAYQELRDLGPAVWMRRLQMFALSRFADVREALRNWEAFSSARGAAMNAEINEAIAGNTLGSDPPKHERLRAVLVRPLVPAAMREVNALIEGEAEKIVEQLVGRPSFDAAVALAQHLPLTVVSHLVGLPEGDRGRMIEWGNAAFDSLGPANARGLAARRISMGLIEYAFTKIDPAALKPGSWGARAFEAAARGEITADEARGLILDYVAPSLDTTIFAISNAVWLFGTHPDQWDLLRADLGLMPGAINEVLRLESPVQIFSRYVTRAVQVDGVTLPANSRAMVMYGSANRDERKWTEPERFDIRRKAAEQLAFGHGEHLCVGLPLARLEMRAILESLARRVKRFEVLDMERGLNNTLRGLKRLEVTAHRA